MFATRALLGNPVKVPWRTGLLWKPQKWTQTRKRNWRYRIAKTQDVESVLRQAAGGRGGADTRPLAPAGRGAVGTAAALHRGASSR